jgi:transposase
MIHLPGSVRVYLCLAPCDMRKSFDGLAALVREHLELDAFAGHLYVFASRRRDRVKILYWERDGFAIWSKRLEEGTYAVPLGESSGQRQQEITVEELGALLSGIDLAQAVRRKRYRRLLKKKLHSKLFFLLSK